jgi:hypothetical protein
MGSGGDKREARAVRGGGAGGEGARDVSDGREGTGMMADGIMGRGEHKDQNTTIKL